MSQTDYAPVSNVWQQRLTHPDFYIVKKEDTIYSIAWAFGMDYRVLALKNHLVSPYQIYPGQRLSTSEFPNSKRLQASKNTPRIVKVYPAFPDDPHLHQKKVSYSQHATLPHYPIVLHWVKPAKGFIIKRFFRNLLGHQGIDIAGRLGTPVYAAAAGTVVYSGDGVRGYGNLLIIKHSDHYLSAYAFSQKLLVKLGQSVRAGQQVAKMGRNEAGRVLLHFEIRRNGLPVNPQHYIRT